MSTPPPPVSPENPRNIFVFPAWSENNPYLNMLYLVARTRGWVLQLATRLGPLYDHLGNARRGDIVHVHWTAPVAQHAPNLDDARMRFRTFATQLRRAKRTGVTIIWTVHNKVPHDCPYPEVEQQLARFLVEIADVIITINPRTPELVADLYALDPAKTVNLAHPSYQGLYPEGATPEESRARLGIPDDRRTVLFFGQMRRYKGLDVLFEAMDELHRAEPRALLLLAGKTNAGDREWIDRELPPSLPVVRQHEFIPDEDIQYWFAAAETVVLPFQSFLNSGSIFLCATFGRSVVVPRQPAVEGEFGPQSWLNYYDAESGAAGLRNAITRSLEHRDEDRVAALAFAASRPPSRLAWDFDRLLSTLP